MNRPPTPEPSSQPQANSAARATPFARLAPGQIALIAAAIVLIYALSGVIMLIFFAILLAAILRGAADWVVARTAMPTGLALTLVILLLFGLLFGLFYWSVPHLAAELRDLLSRLATEIARLRSRLQGSPLMGQAPGLQGVVERVIAPVTTVFTFSLTATTETAIAVITAIYFAAAPGVYLHGMVRLAPIRFRARLTVVMQAVAHTLRMWVLGQLIDMLAVGVLACAGLWATGVPAPFALGIIAGLFTFVPYVGTIVSGALAILIALTVGFSTALWALGVFTVCHVVEGYVIAPLVQRRILELPPALTVLSMTVLGSLFGLAGVILGTPIAATTLVLVQSLYVGDVLGDHEVDRT